MTAEQINKIENAFKHGDECVFQIGKKIYVAEEVLKHRKEATIEFVRSFESDESCFESNGEYYGDVLPSPKTFILEDTYADNENIVALVYYEDEIKEVK